MIIQEIRSIKSGKKELREFGITFGIVLSLLGGLFLWRGRDYYTWFFIFSGVFISLGVAAPIILKPIQKIWMALAIVIGWVMSRVILIILFYLIITPIGLLAKLFGKDFLNRKFDRTAESYWIMRKSTGFDKRSYENQF